MSFVMQGRMSRALFLCILLCSSCSVSTGGGLEPNPANAESEQKVSTIRPQIVSKSLVPETLTLLLRYFSSDLKLKPRVLAASAP